MKIVINNCFGGFSLSEEARQWLADRGHKQALREIACSAEVVARGGRLMHGYCLTDICRDDPMLVSCVEALGAKANGECAKLKVVDAHDDWWVQEYDGFETLQFGIPADRGGLRLTTDATDDETCGQCGAPAPCMCGKEEP